MSKSVVFTSATGNTKQLAEAINAQVSAGYCGAPADSALESEVIFVGFWAKAFSCDDAVAEFLKKCKNKKIFLFGTVGYDNTEEYYNKILTNVKEHIDSSNEIVGSYLCMGKVSQAKQNAIKEMDETKYNGMKAKLDEAESHPTADEVTAVKSAVASI